MHLGPACEPALAGGAPCVPAFVGCDVAPCEATGYDASGAVPCGGVVGDALGASEPAVVEPVDAPFDARGTAREPDDALFGAFDPGGANAEPNDGAFDPGGANAEPNDGAIENGDDASLGATADAAEVGSALPPDIVPDAGMEDPPLASDGAPPPIVGDGGRPVDVGTSTWPGARDVANVSVDDVGRPGSESPPSVDGCTTGVAAKPGVAAWPGTPMPDAVWPKLGCGTIDAPVR